MKELIEKLVALKSDSTGTVYQHAVNHCIAIVRQHAMPDTEKRNKIARGLQAVIDGRVRKTTFYVDGDTVQQAVPDTGQQAEQPAPDDNWLMDSMRASAEEVRTWKPWMRRAMGVDEQPATGQASPWLQEQLRKADADRQMMTGCTEQPAPDAVERGARALATVMGIPEQHWRNWTKQAQAVIAAIGRAESQQQTGDAVERVAKLLRRAFGCLGQDHEQFVPLAREVIAEALHGTESPEGWKCVGGKTVDHCCGGGCVKASEIPETVIQHAARDGSRCPSVFAHHAGDAPPRKDGAGSATIAPSGVETTMPHSPSPAPSWTCADCCVQPCGCEVFPAKDSEFSLQDRIAMTSAVASPPEPTEELVAMSQRYMARCTDVTVPVMDDGAIAVHDASGRTFYAYPVTTVAEPEMKQTPAVCEHPGNQSIQTVPEQSGSGAFDGLMNALADFGLEHPDAIEELERQEAVTEQPDSTSCSIGFPKGDTGLLVMPDGHIKELVKELGTEPFLAEQLVQKPGASARTEALRELGELMDSIGAEIDGGDECRGRDSQLSAWVNTLGHVQGLLRSFVPRLLSGGGVGMTDPKPSLALRWLKVRVAMFMFFVTPSYVWIRIMALVFGMRLTNKITVKIVEESNKGGSP